MDANMLLQLLALLSVCPAYVLAISTADRFNPNHRDNIIGLVVLSAVIFLLICLGTANYVRKHRIGIRAALRRRNASLRALPPSSLFGDQREPDPAGTLLVGTPSYELRDFAIRNKNVGQAAARDVEQPSLPATPTPAARIRSVRSRPSLVGLGIITSRRVETPPPVPDVGDGERGYVPSRLWGPPPTPPPTGPVPALPARAASRGSHYRPRSAVVVEEAEPEAEAEAAGAGKGRFTASRSFSAGL